MRTSRSIAADGTITTNAADVTLSGVGSSFAAIDLLDENAAGSDRTIVQGNLDFGAASAGGLAQVPEPSSVALLILGVLGAATVRRRRLGRPGREARVDP